MDRGKLIRSSKFGGFTLLLTGLPFYLISIFSGVGFFIVHKSGNHQREFVLFEGGLLVDDIIWMDAQDWPWKYSWHSIEAHWRFPFTSEWLANMGLDFLPALNLFPPYHVTYPTILIALATFVLPAAFVHAIPLQRP